MELLLVVLVIAMICAIVGGHLQQRRGKNPVGGFLAGLLLGPLGFDLGRGEPTGRRVSVLAQRRAPGSDQVSQMPVRLDAETARCCVSR